MLYDILDSPYGELKFAPPKAYFIDLREIRTNLLQILTKIINIHEIHVQNIQECQGAMSNATIPVTAWAYEVVLQNRSSFFFWQCRRTCFVVAVLQHRLCCKTNCVTKPHVLLTSRPLHYVLIDSLLSSSIDWLEKPDCSARVYDTLRVVNLGTCDLQKQVTGDTCNP